MVEDNIVLVKKTGHRFALDLKLWHDIFTWFCFYTAAQSWRLRRRLAGHKKPTIAFLPDKPRPWYLIWPVMHCAGAAFAAGAVKRGFDMVMLTSDLSCMIAGARQQLDELKAKTA